MVKPNSYFPLLLFVLNLVEGKNETDSLLTWALPSWITDNEGFKNPTLKDSVEFGKGSVTYEGFGSLSWIVRLNKDLGYGVDLTLEQLSLEPKNEDFLMITPWPFHENTFGEVKLFTGKFKKKRRILIPNTKSILVLYVCSDRTPSPRLFLKYERHGNPYEQKTPSTDPPVKKETVYEIQFKGKDPNQYSDTVFLNKFKEAVRAIAKRYCSKNNIQFNDTKPTNEMIFIRKISLCPFEWPERDICASVQHSAFVSGVKISEEQIIMNYQLTAEHLKMMWSSQTEFPEIESLGITVYDGPKPSKAILWWGSVVSVVVLCSFAGVFVLWKLGIYVKDKRKPSEVSITSKTVELRKKSKLKLSKHQQIPSFMRRSEGWVDEEGKSFDVKFKESTKGGNVVNGKFEKVDASDLPIKNYGGSIFFGNN